MIKASRRTLVFAAAAALALPLSTPREAMGQSGTTVGRTREKLKQASAEAATHPGPSPAVAPSVVPASTGAASQAPAEGASATPGDTGSLTVIASDPNHLSAVKALEQIRLDEQASAEGNSFSYDPGDRRDPFLSPQDVLQAQMAGQICQGEGMECWLIQEVTIIGVLHRASGDVALVIGPDGYGTTLHEGDTLYDGEVRSINSETGLVVFRQKINDPSRIKPFRDVEKGLNLMKEGRS